MSAAYHGFSDSIFLVTLIIRDSRKNGNKPQKVAETKKGGGRGKKNDTLTQIHVPYEQKKHEVKRNEKQKHEKKATPRKKGNKNESAQKRMTANIVKREPCRETGEEE